jgi:hypothetical protein
LTNGGHSIYWRRSSAVHAAESQECKLQQPDRTRFIELLERLGADSDETVLAAARELHRTVSETGLDWDRLLRDDSSTPAETEAPAESSGAADRSGDMKIVDRLLARKDISDTMRSDLTDFQRSIREGNFDRMDADYLRALAKRLGA